MIAKETPRAEYLGAQRTGVVSQGLVEVVQFWLFKEDSILPVSVETKMRDGEERPRLTHHHNL